MRRIISVYVIIVLTGFVVWFFIDDGIPDAPVLYPSERPAPRHGLSTFFEGYASGATLGGWEHFAKSVRTANEDQEVKVRAIWWPRAGRAGEWAGWITFAALVAYLAATRRRRK